MYIRFLRIILSNNQNTHTHSWLAGVNVLRRRAAVGNSFIPSILSRMLMVIILIAFVFSVVFVLIICVFFCFFVLFDIVFNVY